MIRLIDKKITVILSKIKICLTGFMLYKEGPLLRLAFHRPEEPEIELGTPRYKATGVFTTSQPLH